MQTNKGFVSYKGKLLIEHALDQLTPFCSEIILSANRNEYERFGYSIVKDVIYGIGPLGGIYSAMQKSTYDVSLIITCDILGAGPSLLAGMISKAKENMMVYLKEADNKVYPLPMALHKNVLPFIEMQIEKNDFTLHHFIHTYEQSNASGVECMRIKNQLQNLNTLDDLKL